MKLKLITNYAIKGSINRHVVNIDATYFSVDVQKGTIYVYKKNKGYILIDLSKIFEIDVYNRGYINRIEVNDGKIIEILPKEHDVSILIKKVGDKDGTN